MPTLQTVARSQTVQTQVEKFTFEHLRIRTKDKRIIPFEPNAVQEKYLNEICPNWKQGDYKMSGKREMILKARQFGFSTLLLAVLFLDTINTPNTQTVVIAHDSESSERLFQMVQRFYQYLPEESRPRTKYANRREFLWPDIDSYFFVGTAGSGEFGRGGTINNVHASEVAFWPNAEDIMAGLMQAVPADGNVFQESTANGVGSYFCEEFERAQAGQSALHARFFAWFEHDDYQKAAEAGFTDTEEESRLRALYSLTSDQLQWRRNKRREPGMKKKFVQEYPANPREAFISSGNPYFDLEKLDELAEQLKDSSFDPIEVEIPGIYADLKRNAEYLEVWEEPRVGAVYVVGADTANGINSHGDHDYNSASVWDAETGRQVAHFHARNDPHVFGCCVGDLGFWYNMALVGVERNGHHGGTALSAVRFTKNYPEALTDNSTGLYMHQEYDEKRQPRERRMGFPMDGRTKYFILDELQTAIEEDNFHPRSRALVAEMVRFVKLPNGKAGAETGHDDRVMDAAIARRMLNLRPRRAQEFFFNIR